MRFDSFKAFITFLKALGDLGYQVPFNDYETDFKNKGFNMHIHFYKFNLSVTDKYLLISTCDLYGNYYSIKCIRTDDTIKSQLKILLNQYIRGKHGIKQINGANYLLRLLEVDDNEKI